MFAIIPTMAARHPSDGLRWPLADQDEAGALFPDERQANRHVGTGEYRGLEFLHVNARKIINSVPGSALPFRYTINAYRGCSHACTYCFARPTHEYLGLGVGTDFETKIVVKINAVERLKAELGAPAWAGEAIAMGTNTDPYQSAEGKYHLTQGIIKVLTEAANPFSILTKSTLVLRDLALLVEASKRTEVRLDLSIGTLDREVWRLSEPGTPPPERRIDAVRRLNEAGVACGVLVAPILPGLSDREDQVRAVVSASLDAGAVSVAAVPLHLRPGVKDHYLGWLATARPELVPRHERLFSRGDYQPESERSRLAKLTMSVIEERFAETGTKPSDRHWRRRGDVDPEQRQAGSDNGPSAGERPGSIPVQLRLIR